MNNKTYAYDSLTERIKTEWIIYLLAFIFILIADKIGQIRIPVWKGTFIIFPIFFSLGLGLLTGPNVLKILDDKRVKAAGSLVGIAILPFIAKLGINAGANIMTVIEVGPALLLQEFGNLGTIFLSLPIALMLGLKRESIGACHSINRETNLALIQDMYGASSPEGMASGVGAGILMSSASATLAEIYPAMADKLSALAAASETVSGIDGIYLAIFIGLPLCNWLYRKLEPKIGRITKYGRREQE